MSEKINTNNPNDRYDTVKWIVFFSIIALGVYGNYYFSEQLVLYRSIALLFLGMVSIFVGFKTKKGLVLWKLMNEAKNELRKVVWPSKQETTQTTLMVLCVVLVMGFILWGLDSLLGWVISSIIG